jgi:hypothetical protein
MVQDMTHVRILQQHEIYLKRLSEDVDLLCGLVVRVLSYRSGGPGSIPGTTRKKK